MMAFCLLNVLCHECRIASQLIAARAEILDRHMSTRATNHTHFALV